MPKLTINRYLGWLWAELMNCIIDWYLTIVSPRIPTKVNCTTLCVCNCTLVKTQTFWLHSYTSLLCPSESREREFVLISTGEAISSESMATAYLSPAHTLQVSSSSSPSHTLPGSASSLHRNSLSKEWVLQPHSIVACWGLLLTYTNAPFLGVCTNS